jgi:hypothetical protein
MEKIVEYFEFELQVCDDVFHHASQYSTHEIKYYKEHQERLIELLEAARSIQKQLEV